MSLKPISATEGVVSIREFQDSDRAYVIRTWVLCMQPEGVWSSTGSLVEHMLKSSKISVACLTQSPEVIVGFVVYREGSLMHLSVRRRWRGLGCELALYNETAQCP